MSIVSLNCDAEWCECPECHARIRRPPDWPADRLKHRCRPGLGDRVASALAAVGITPERVASTLGVKDCGCNRRKAAMNEVGRRLGIG